MAVGPSAGFFEGGGDDSLATVTGEDRGLDGDVLGAIGVQAAADVGVFALGVLAKDLDVDRTGRLVSQGTLDPVIEIRGSQADALVESAADRKQESVERDVVLDLGVSDGTQQDGVVAGERIEEVVGGHPAVFEVVLTAPGVGGPFEGCFIECRGGFDRPDRLPSHLGANPVSFDDCDIKDSRHVEFSGGATSFRGCRLEVRAAQGTRDTARSTSSTGTASNNMSTRSSEVMFSLSARKVVTSRCLSTG